MLFKVIKFVRACLFHYLCSRFYYINNKKLYEKDFAQCHDDHGHDVSYSTRQRSGP